MRAALIDGNKVINVLVVDSLDVMPNLIDGTGANIGDTWDGHQFIPAPIITVVPQVITPRQCRLQLLTETLLDEVEAAIGTMPQAAQIEWEYALEVKRTYGLVVAMQALLSKNDTEMDTFFVEAAKL